LLFIYLIKKKGMKMLASATINLQNEPYAKPIIFKVGSAVAFGYLITKIFIKTNPVVGAIFAVTWSILDSLISNDSNITKGYLHSTDFIFLKTILTGFCSLFITNQFMKIPLMKGLMLTTVS